MPFFSAKDGIARLVQRLRKGQCIGKIMRRVEQSAAAHQHGAAGRADCAGGGTHDTGVSECRAFADEGIHIWRYDVFIAQGVDGVKSLIIGEQEQDIWPLVGVWLPRRNTSVATQHRCRSTRSHQPQEIPPI